MNTTTHPIAPEEIMAFVDGELSADRAQSIFTHIEQCAECREDIDSLRNTSQSLSNWRVKVPQSLHDSKSVSGPQGITHAGKLERGISRLRDTLSRRWVWAPAL